MPSSRRNAKSVPQGYSHGSEHALAEDLSHAIAAGRDHPRLRWEGSLRNRVRLTGTSDDDASSPEFFAHIEEKLSFRGWVSLEDGWWKRTHHADLSHHPALHLCGTCGYLDRLDPERAETTPCLRCQRRGMVHPGVELCWCCGEVLLDYRTRNELWFCHFCEMHVRDLNARLGRFVVPLGPSHTHSEPWVPNGADPVDRLIYSLRREQIADAMRRLGYWASLVVVRESLGERFDSPPGWIPIRDWDRRVEMKRDGANRFERMLAWLQANPVGRDIAMLDDFPPLAR